MFLNKKKGVAGLELFTGIIVSIFMIGLIVMVLQISGARLLEANLDSTAGVGTNESLGNVTDLAYTSFSVSGYRSVVCTISKVWNTTNTSAVIDFGNYTQNGCSITPSATSSFNDTEWSLNYTYVYDAVNGATDSINETMVATGDASSYFNLFIILGAMVTIILMLVLVIRAVKGSGITGGDGA